MNIKEILSRAVKKRRAVDYILYLSIIFGGIGIDQLTKWLSVKFLKQVGSVGLWEGVLHLTYVENTGAAFGMLKGAPWVFNTFSVIAIVALSAYLFLGHANTALYGISMSMIISGGIGNMIDRTFLGYVVDFIDFRIINFAVFNGADSFVCVGAGLMILALILEMVEESRAEGAKKERAELTLAHKEDGEDD